MADVDIFTGGDTKVYGICYKRQDNTRYMFILFPLVYENIDITFVGACSKYFTRDKFSVVVMGYVTRR